MKLAATVMLMTSMLGACEPPSPAPVVPKAEGREETRAIRNTENIGVSGNAIADQVDGALKIHEERDAELRKAEESAAP